MKKQSELEKAAEKYQSRTTPAEEYSDLNFIAGARWLARRLKRLSTNCCADCQSDMCQLYDALRD